jgi:hypothetical protein
MIIIHFMFHLMIMHHSALLYSGFLIVFVSRIFVFEQSFSECGDLGKRRHPHRANTARMTASVHVPRAASRDREARQGERGR